MKIESNFIIKKVQDRVFQIGDICLSNSNFKDDIINLLNLGSKFIPSFFLNDFYLYSNIFYNIENSLVNFNKQIFLINLRNEKNFSNSNADVSFIDESLDFNAKKFFKNVGQSLDNIQKYPLQKETLDFKFEILKQLNRFNFKRSFFNISKNQFRAIKDFIKNKPFTVSECDKNIGLAILSNETYETLCQEHLCQIDNFIELTENPIEQAQDSIKNCLIDLFLNRNISNKMLKKLFIENPKLGNFRILPKLHKSKFSTRPIINCINHPTSNLSFLIDFLLQPYVKLSQSFIQDSQNFLQKLNNERFPSNIKIYSLDFESLYSNIKLDHALNVITEFMKDKINNEHLNIKGFYSILKLVFENNVFTYKNKFYRQIKGVAMGTKCGPSIANIYISCLEKNFLFIHKPLAYYRFIDDIFVILLDNFNIQLLLDEFGYLKLNVTSSKNVNFLDLNISYCKLTKKLKFTLYIKPTQTFCYLLIDSNHPEFIFDNIPKSLFIRIKRICSNFIDFLHFSSILCMQLVSRGYDLDKLNKVLNTVSDMDRDELIPYKDKKKLEFDNSIIFKTPFDKNFYFLKDLIHETYSKIQLNNKKLSHYKLFNVFNMQSNISALLIHKIYSFNFYFNCKSFLKCKDSKCVVCKFSNSKKFIKLNSFLLPIITYANCNSEKFVYIIHCKKCQQFYIGESKRKVKCRIGEHLKDIEHFVPYEKRFTAVAKHFNLSNHSLLDFSFFVFDQDLEDIERKNLEAQLIKLSLEFEIKIMNEKIPSIYNNIFKIKV